MDRLRDLKKNKQTFEIEVEDEPKANTNTKAGDGVGGTERGSMDEFFKVIEVVKKCIVDIIGSTKEIVEMNHKFVMSTNESEEDKASEGLQQVISNGNKSAKSAQQLLTGLNKEIAEIEQKNSFPPSELRIRKNLIQTLTKKYIDILKEYQDAQNKSKEFKKKRAVKRIQQAKPGATAEEIEAVVQAGGANNLMKYQILQGDASDVIRAAYEKVSNKYQDVLKLEASVAELSQLFQDFALVVEQQGELLDQIEYQVKSASNYIDEANVDVSKAIDLQISVRKKQCCIAIVIIIILGIIVGVAAGVAKK